ncbi:MAG TPA: hypothetical protein VJC10_00930 [Patescibacteria group bacterium]|nr:hypothetical protein [Patescibacteria group bacterium]
MGNSEKAVLKTLLYSDIFSFPLTLDEVFEFLISNKKYDKDSVKRALAKLSPLIDTQDKYYCLKGRKNIIAKRIEKKRFSEKKSTIAVKFSKRLSLIPSVLFIGISGGVAALNADKNDDIDLFIITKKNTLWSTRLCVLLLLELYGARRKRNREQTKNKICVNMLLDKSSLSFLKNRQNIYTAREIAQLVPVFDRDSAYSNFLRSNSWVKKHLANSTARQVLIQYRLDTTHRLSQKMFRLLNPLAKQIQMIRINKHKTTEEVTDTLLAFHPKDYAASTLQSYKKRVRQAEKLYNTHLNI